MNGKPKSDLIRIQRDLGHGILGDIHTTDRSGFTSSIYVQRATITFTDDSKLYITEYTNKLGFIEKYYYDWEDKSGYLITRIRIYTRLLKASLFSQLFHPALLLAKVIFNMNLRTFSIRK